MITKKILYLFSIFILLNACGGFTELSSKNLSGNTGTDEATPSVPDTQKFYTITNDFQNYQGVGPAYIYLQSTKSGKSYIVPPTKYSSRELKYAVVEDIKVEGECLKVPEEDFPLSVGVCQSNECSSVRPLDAILKNPAHYNISGIGGLLTPQIYPVSPCSKDYVELIESANEYQKL